MAAVSENAVLFVIEIVKKWLFPAKLSSGSGRFLTGST